MTPTTKKTATAILALAALAPLPACNIVGTAAYIIEGPPKVPAQTSLDAKRPTTIFIDDRANKIPRRSLRTVIGKEAEETLIAEKIIKQENMIAAQSTLRAAMSESPESPMSVADIGRAVGAEVVVYVTIDAWTLSKDSSSFSPLAATRVKIIDAQQRTRIWPQDDRGFPLRVEPNTRAARLPSTSAERAKAEADLAKRVGTSIAKLFYESEKEAVRDR